jgi:hypothetical protein
VLAYDLGMGTTSQYGVDIPAGYEQENWPWPQYASWEEVRGWVTRMRFMTSSREGRRIAEEAGISWTTFKRMVRWYLVSVGEYSPDEWRSSVLTANAGKRAYWKERRHARDRQVKRENESLKTQRDALAHQRLVQEWIEEDQNPAVKASQPRSPEKRGQDTGRGSEERGGGLAARALTPSEREARGRARRLRQMLGPTATPQELGL